MWVLMARLRTSSDEIVEVRVGCACASITRRPQIPADALDGLARPHVRDGRAGDLPLVRQCVQIWHDDMSGNISKAWNAYANVRIRNAGACSVFWPGRAAR
jgi:hypothetical protein